MLAQLALGLDASEPQAAEDGNSHVKKSRQDTWLLACLADVKLQIHPPRHLEAPGDHTEQCALEISGGHCLKLSDMWKLLAKYTPKKTRLAPTSLDQQHNLSECDRG